MTVDVLDIVAGAAKAAFSTDRKHRIVAWNKAAERLFGYEEPQVLGKRCYQMFCATVLFGNRFCDGNCPLLNMARRREPACDFKLDMRTATSEVFRTNVSTIVAPGRASSDFAIIHFFKPQRRIKEAEQERRRYSRLGSTHATLTRREIEVLRLLANGTVTQEIAGLLFISVATAATISNTSRTSSRSTVG